MDALSEKGLRFHKMTQHAIGAVESEHVDLLLVDLAITYPATIDYLIIKNNQLSGIVEFKVRESGINKYQLDIQNRPVFLSVDKFNKGVQLADHLGVPFFFWVYLPDDNCVVSWMIYNPVDGQFIEFKHQKTSTQKSTNDRTTRNKPIIAIPGNKNRRVVNDIEPFE